MASKTLITGGAGFIGSHLAERLRAAGRAVVLVDDLSTGRRSNVEHLLGPGCELIVAKASEALADDAVMAGVDRVFHLAAAVGVKLVVDDPTAMIRTNIDETVAALDAAARHDAAVLIASSSEVYGKCPTLPLSEDMELVYGPTTASRWSYGLAKALDEHLALDAARRRGVRAVVARFFNTIGPRQVGRYGMVVPRFVEAAVTGRTLEVYGDGTQTRAFSDVRDVCAAIDRMADTPVCYGRVFNVGTDHTVTILELARRIVALAHSESPVVLVPYERVYGPGFEDPPHRLPDLSRLREAIGLAPRWTLDQTLGELIAHRRAADSGAADDTKDAELGTARGVGR